MVNYHWPRYFSKRIWKVGATWAHSLASFFLSKYTFGWCPLATIICENLEKKKEKIHSQLQKKILILVVTNSWTWGFTWKRNCTLKHAHIDHWQPLEPPVASSFACSSHANRGQLGKNRWINMLPKMMEKIIVFSGLPVIFSHMKGSNLFLSQFTHNIPRKSIHETLTIFASKNGI